MKKIILLLVIIFLFPQINPIFADEQQIDLPSVIINPDSFYYPIKRLWEKVREKFEFSNEARIKYDQNLTITRLAELKFVVDNKLLSEVQHSSERFAYQAGILTDDLVKQNKDKEKFLKEFDQFSKFLEGLRDKYPANSSFWMLIQHDINSLSILSNRLK